MCYFIYLYFFFLFCYLILVHVILFGFGNEVVKLEALNPYIIKSICMLVWLEIHCFIHFKTLSSFYGKFGLIGCIDTVITVFRSTWNDKNQCNGVATNLFCLGVIGHRKVYLSIKIKIN